MKSNAIRRVIVIVLVTLMLAIAPASKAGLVEQGGDTWVLVVSVGLEGGRATKNLVSTLVEGYGIQSRNLVELYDQNVSRSSVYSAVGRIQREATSRDQVFVLLSVPLVQDDRSVAMLDSEMERVDVLGRLEERDILGAISQLRADSILIAYPNCSGRTGREVGRNPSAMSQISPRREGVVELLQICNTFIARQGDAKGNPPGGQKRGEIGPRILGELSRYLRNSASRGVPAVPATEVVDAIDHLLPGVLFTLERVPQYARSEFIFYSRPSRIGVFREQYVSARSYQERVEVLRALVDVARLRGGTQAASAVRLLRDIAVDPVALARDAERGAVQELRRNAVEAIGRIDDPIAFDTLAEVYRSAKDFAPARSAAVTRLARLERPRAEDLAVVREALSDSDEGVRDSALRGVAFSRDEKAAIQVAAISASGTESASARALAVEALSAIGTDTHRVVLESALVDRELQVRKAAATGLGRLGSSAKSTSALIDRLRVESDDRVREQLAFSIGRTWTPDSRDSAVASLSSAIDVGPDLVRQACAISLGRIGGRSAESELKELLADRKRDEAVRVSAAEALGQLRSDDGVPALVAASGGDESSQVRRAATSALAVTGTRMTTPGLVARLSDADPAVRATAERGLIGLTDPEPEALLNGLQHSGAFVRLVSAKKAGVTPNESYLAKLLPLLTDESAEVRDQAVSSLGNYRNTKAIGAIGEIATTSQDVAGRWGAVRALGLTGSVEALGYLMRAVADTDAVVRAQAVRALGRFRDPSSNAAIVAASKDRAPEVRLAVAETVVAPFDNRTIATQVLTEMVQKDPSEQVRVAALKSLDKLSSNIVSESRVINRDYVFDITHSTQGGLSASSRTYTKEFPAQPGYRIVSASLSSQSRNNAKDVSVQVAPDGKSVTVSATLAAGPVFDQWRGWAKGTVLTKQEPQ